MTGVRQISLDKADAFLPGEGVIHHKGTDTYVRLRRSDTLRFDKTKVANHAYVGNVQLSWPLTEWPTLRQQLTDWWLKRKVTV